jgi:hypothetical protein
MVELEEPERCVLLLAPDWLELLGLALLLLLPAPSPWTLDEPCELELSITLICSPDFTLASACWSDRRMVMVLAL